MECAAAGVREEFRVSRAAANVTCGITALISIAYGTRSGLYYLETWWTVS
jgi:hypothetical protein